MPWRLITILVIFGLFLAFITFNLENRCDISFGFKVIEDTPVFLTIFFSFSFGLICALPFIVRARYSRRKPPKEEPKEEIERIHGNIQPDGGIHGAN